MKHARLGALFIALVCLGTVPRAFAGLADTLPQGLMIVETSYVNRVTESRFSNSGKVSDLVDPIDRFDVTGEFQGQITVPGKFSADIWLTKVAVGITDRLTLAAVFPVFLERKVELNLGWVEGDPLASNNFEPFSRDDFWEWAESLGQPEPPDFKDDTFEKGDVILAAFYNFWRSDDLKLTAFGFWNTRSGSSAAPEVVGSVGTSFFELDAIGDIGIHILSDYVPPYPVLDRFTFSLEGFYEHFFEHKKHAGTGRLNPLLLNDAPFTGPWIRIDPGDFYGWAAQIGFRIWQGPSSPTWLTRQNPALQESLPPVLTVDAKLTNLYSFDDNYKTHSPQFDLDQENENQAQVKWNWAFTLRASLLRFGIPLDVFGQYFDQSLIPGRNFRPATGYEVGLRLYAPSPVSFLLDWIWGDSKPGSGEIEVSDLWPWRFGDEAPESRQAADHR
ncbi:MAG: hypothetical protein KC466_02600 [Myxococcales bacterium]|nr:hypothetical protein [Myxococcales bacterium]